MGIPYKAVTEEVFLVGSRSITTGALTTVAAAAAGAYTKAGAAITDLFGLSTAGIPVGAGIMKVSQFRRMGIWLAVNGAASEASAKTSLLVLVSGATQIAGAFPTGIMDTWYAAAVTDNSVTSAALGGAMPASQAMTATPNWGTVAEYGANITTPALTAASDRLRLRYTVDVGDAVWMQILYAESGDTNHPSTIALSVTGGM